MKINSRIEGIREAVVRIDLVVALRNVLVLLDQEDMALEDNDPDARDLGVVLEEEGDEDLVAVEAADRHSHRLSQAQEVHETLEYNTVHVPRMVDIVDAERATLRSQPCCSQPFVSRPDKS